MDRFLALKASAGSGKTFNLVIRYISLLFMGAKSEEILTLTFTNKASNEMKMRIFDVIKNLDKNEDKYRNYLERISKNLNKPQKELLEKKELLFKNFLISDIKIMTIDKFLNKVLRNFCWYVGINNDFSIKDDRREFIKRVFLKSLNEDELKSVIEFSHHQEKGLRELFHLFELFYQKDKELPKVRFEAMNSIENLQERVLSEAFKIKDFYQNHPKISNRGFNALEFNNIKEFFKKSETWLSKNSLREYGDFKKKELQNDEIEEVFINLKSLLKEYFIANENETLKRLFDIYEIFKKHRLNYKFSKNELSFDDVTNLTYDLLRGKIENQFLYFRLDSQISHILIDEFQDTSVVQFKILEPIIEEIRASEERTFFYVGDTKQSIYRFRGGRRELFDFLIKKYDFGVENLNTNYRSKEVIVNFINEVFKNKIENYQDQKANLELNKGGYVEIVKSEEYLQSLKYVVKKLLLTGVKETDITILAFKNSDILTIKEFLEDNIDGVKIVTETTSKLKNQASVMAIINFIKYLYFKENIYKSNFLALIGKNPSEELTFTNYNLLVKPIEIVKQIADDYGIFDENILKFIEVSFKYKDLNEFVYEIDVLGASMATKIKNGITVMTIHKSKGLEFKHLIVMDRMGGKNYDKNLIMFDYENVKLKSIKYKFKYRSSVDDDYMKVIEKEEKEKIIDTLNTLYVALTRAEDSLFIIAKEKSEFNILNLESKTFGELLIYEQEKEIEISKKAFEINLQNYGRQSDIINEEQQYQPNDIEAMKFGLATHYMFENLIDFDVNSLDLAKEKTNNKFGVYLNEKIETIYKIVKNTIEHEKFKNLIGGKIYKELPFSYKKELKRLDLMVEKESAIYIIDYKTSSENSLAYEEQVIEYKKALKSIKNIENIYGYLIFVNEYNIKIKEI